MIKKERYQTRNGAFVSGRKIAVKGIVLHSYGCPQPDPAVLAERWDSPDATACVHAHIGKEDVIVTLPCEEERGRAVRGWHVGKGANGSGNDTHLSAEMTEPASLRYVGGSKWVELGDGSNTKAHVLATYKNAVDLFAQWCSYHGLDPLEDGVILSHREASAYGIASNHGDVEHIWSHFGLTMNRFRKDIQAAMEGGSVDFGSAVEITDTSGQHINPLEGIVTVRYAGEDGLNVRRGPAYDAAVAFISKAGDEFIVTGVSADEKWYRTDSGLYISAVPAYVSFKDASVQKEPAADAGYYRVRLAWDRPDSQIAACKVKRNAVELCRQNCGYKVYDSFGKEIYPCIEKRTIPMTIRVKVSDLRIRKGPGITYDYHKKDGKALLTGKGKFTIVKVEDGAGAKQWGLLMAYQDAENGWVALDDTYVDIL